MGTPSVRRAAAPVGLVLLAGLLTACAPTPQPAPVLGTTEEQRQQEGYAPHGWSRVARSPLAARYDPFATWIDGRFIVLGGHDDRACPANASCIEAQTAARRDGAVYDPATDTWRRIADAPVAVDPTRSAVVGSDLYLGVRSGEDGTRERLLRYETDRDRWVEVPVPPSTSGSLIEGGGRLYAIGSAKSHGEQVDATFDPGSGTWTPLPSDPISSSSDREAIWADGDLLLLSKDTDRATRNQVRLSVLWSAAKGWSVPQRLPVIGAGATLVGADLVLPMVGTQGSGISAGLPYGGVYDVATHRWTDLAPFPKSAATDWPVPRALPVDSGVVERGLRFTPGDDAWTPLPRFPGAARNDAGAASSGGTVLVWGDSSRSLENLADGYLLHL